MSKLRLLFSKEGTAAYLSHLDTMRTFQRVFPRAALHLKHSNGFHPHPIISIVLPLPVGQESVCEILDFETVEESDGAGVAEKLNSGLPDGLRVLDCYPMTRPAREFAYLRTRLELVYDAGVPAGAVERIGELLGRDELLIEKRTKHKDLSTVNVAPLLHSFAVEYGGEGLVLDLIAAAQNPGLNPAYLAQAIERELPGDAPDFVRVRRLETLDAQLEAFR